MSNTAIARALAFIGAGVALDQVTKVLAEARLPGNPFPLIKGAFTLEYVRNYAAAFGLGNFISDAGTRMWMLLGLTSVLTLVLFFGMIRSPDFASRLGYGITIAGAVGNIIDRVRLGYVIDFFRWHGGFEWPVFNVADICVSVGIGILLVFGGKSARNKPGKIQLPDPKPSMRL